MRKEFAICRLHDMPRGRKLADGARFVHK
jgi:hypothetical protein